MSPSEGEKPFVTLRPSQPRGGPAHPLRVLVKRRDGAVSPDSRISVLDGWEEPRGDGSGEITLSLPAGLYTVRVERGGVVNEEIVRHTAARTLERPEPQRPSALPTFDTVDCHEYYSYTAQKHSLRDTDHAAPVFGAAHERAGRLFVFVRAESKEKYHGEDLSESLFLYDAQGARLSDFNSNAALQDREYGWMALSIAAPAGRYRLHFSGLRSREMVLPVFAGWETQLFVPFDRRPNLARASILLAARGKGFHPDDRTAQVVDAALKGLQSGIDVLPSDEREMLLYGKFENPLLGLIGAHLLLLQRRPRWDVLAIVIGNLEALLPGSPDVHALRLAVALRGGGDAPAQPSSEPPLLRRGFELLLEASASKPELIVEGSLVERIAPYLLADSPWTTWSQPTMVAGTALEDPLATVREFATAELEQSAGAPVAAFSSMPREQVSRLLKAALPGVLARVGEKAQRGLERGLEELSSAATERMLESALTTSESAAIRSVSQAVLNGVDAALRAEPEPPSAPGTPEAVPAWVRNVIEEAKRRGEATDLASLARRTRLPVRVLRRLLSQSD
jgi:hypothetical protein